MHPMLVPRLDWTILRSHFNRSWKSRRSLSAPPLHLYLFLDQPPPTRRVPAIQSADSGTDLPAAHSGTWIAISTRRRLGRQPKGADGDAEHNCRNTRSMLMSYTTKFCVVARLSPLPVFPPYGHSTVEWTLKKKKSKSLRRPFAALAFNDRPSNCGQGWFDAESISSGRGQPSPHHHDVGDQKRHGRDWLHNEISCYVNDAERPLVPTWRVYPCEEPCMTM